MKPQITESRSQRGTRARKRGKWVERFVRFYLWLKRYRILAHNHKTYWGEIDVVFWDKKTLVIGEIKFRPSLEGGMDAIAPRQRQRLERATLGFLQKNPQYQNHAVRFDALIVTKFLRITHVKNAWESRA